MKAILLSLCAMVLLVGCVNRGNLRVERAGETLDIYHEGKRIKQRHAVDAEWGKPGDVSYTTCRPDQLSHDSFWGINTCADTIDPNATLAVEAGRVQTASYKDLVIPATITGLFQVAAFGTLGAVMPRTHVSNSNTTNASVNVRASTFAGDVPTGFLQVPK